MNQKYFRVFKFCTVRLYKKHGLIVKLIDESLNFKSCYVCYKQRLYNIPHLGFPYGEAVGVEV